MRDNVRSDIPHAAYPRVERYSTKGPRNVNTDVQEDVLGPPHGTTTVVVISN